ncbi:MAG: hypothetical protein ACKO96_00015, partial [Flammeovirgaceae bacterium]
MGFNWHSPIVTRIGILVLTNFAFAYVMADNDRSIILMLGLLGAIGFQIIQLVRLVEPNQHSWTEQIKFD